MQPFRVSLWTPQVTPWDESRPVALDITELTFTPRIFVPGNMHGPLYSFNRRFTKWVCECGHVIASPNLCDVPSSFTFGNMEAHAAGHAVAREFLCLR